MTPAAAANEYKSNIGPDFTLADAYNAEYVDTDAAETLENFAALRQMVVADAYSHVIEAEATLKRREGARE